MPDPNINTDHQRISFVDPQNIYGRINDIPVTPDYTDYCISVDLQVTTYSRLRRGAGAIAKANGDNSGVKYHICFQSREGDDSKVMWASMLGGSKLNGKDSDVSYLTTYYTDINYADFKNDNIIEGLGISSINITFESYYTPTIKIKFVDVRGASLFGRDEAVHQHEKIQRDTIWGCFFTFPYPKFALQVKGFYGKAVTYQLTCLDFRGSLNAQTGNFEADTTFIGYDYGLLADIPMAYLTCAPYCPYVGRNYWNEHANSPGWRMSDGKAPIKLFELEKNIKACVSTFNGKENVVKNPSLAANISEELNKVNELKQIYDEGIGNIEHTVTQIKDKPAWYCQNLNYSAFSGAVSKLSEKLNEYVERYPNSKGNGLIKFKIQNKPLPKAEKIDDYYNNDITPKDSLDLKNQEYENAHFLDSQFTLKGYLVYIGEFYEVLTQRIEELNTMQTENEETVQQIEESDLNSKNISELLGVLPLIGNIFKIVMCHLETFAAIMYEANREIQQQIQQKQRRMQDMGIKNYEMTDIAINDNGEELNLPPWPAIYTKDDSNDDNSRYAWIGELNSKREWVETKVVNALALAAKLNNVVDSSGESATMPMSAFPIIPIDFTRTIPPFVLNGVEDTSGWFALRAASIFGVGGINEKYAEIVGKMDALNYYQENNSQSMIKDKLINACGGSTLDSVMYNTSMYIGTTNTPSFQYTKEKQPFFKKKNSTLTYSYTRTPYDTGVIPVDFSNTWADTLKDTFDIRGEKNKTSFDIANNSSGGIDTSIIYNSGSIHMLKQSQFYNPNDGSDYGYINNNMCDIITDDTTIQKIKDAKDTLEDSPIYTNEDKTIADEFVKKYWSDSDAYFSSFFKGNGRYFYDYLTDGYKHYGIDTSRMIPNEKDENAEWSKENKIENLNKLFTKSSDDEKIENYITDQDIINEKKVIYPAIYADNGLANLFGTLYYYLQNDDCGHNNETFKKTQVRDAKKAYLFLMCLPYRDEKPWCSRFIDCINIEKMPYGLALKLGAVEWRHQFISAHEYKDCICQTENVYKKTSIGYPNECIHMTTVEKSRVGAYLKANNDKQEYLSYNDLFDQYLDDTTKNRLLQLFVEFVNGEWQDIMSACELKYNGALITSSIYTKICKAINNDTGSSTSSSGNNIVITNWGPQTMKSTFTNSETTYAYILPSPSNEIMYALLREDAPIQQKLRDVYTKQIYITQMHTSGVKGFDINISDNTYRSYLKGFADMINKIVSGEVPTNVTKTTHETQSKDSYDDIRLAMYIWLKSSWDKWFSTNELEGYTVSNYFYKNYIFIDNKYENIRQKLKVNCDKLYDSIANIDGDTTLFKFLGDITTDNNCMFFALPDFISFHGDAGDTSVMEEIFRPIPFKDKGDIQTDNKFIIMYTNPPSQILSEQNNYAYDSFDLYSISGGVVPSTFDHPPLEGADKTNDMTIADTRYGYQLPAFGVAFGTQNNHIFKDIKVGMHNPIQTDQSINAFSMIASKGQNGDHRVVFYGQDLFPVYTGYSYSCDLEMMGNAQIMPLMYFQLMNVPMFRGAYMIYNVSHNITPGNMTTSVKAMKMSKHSMPFPKRFFGESLEGLIGGWWDDAGNYHQNNECGIIDGETPWLTVAQNEMGTKEVGKNGGAAILKYQQSYKGHGTGDAWCGEFVNWCLTQCGIQGAKGGAVAANWANWGVSLTKPATGAIALVHSDPSTPSNKINHVGFVHGITRDGKIVVLGGNQSDMVKDSTYATPPYNIVGYVFPEGYKPDYNLVRMDKINANLKTT